MRIAARTIETIEREIIEVSRRSVRWALAGSLLWGLTLLYFIAEAIVQIPAQPAYSMQYHTISDLGMTSCTVSPFLSRLYACSPLHPLMNLTFIADATLTILGVVYLYVAFRKNTFERIALALVGIGALGLMGVGLFPEDVNLPLHIASATTFLALTHIGIIAFAIGLFRSRQWSGIAWFSLICGVVGFLAFISIPLGMIPPIGVGLVERIAAYPIVLWGGIIGAFLYMRIRQMEAARWPVRAAHQHGLIEAHA